MPPATICLPGRLTGMLVGFLLAACVSTPTGPPAPHRLAAVSNHAAARPQAEPRATAQQQHPPATRPSASYTLAVVPWNTTGREAITYYNGVDALKQSLAGAAFVAVFSAYELPNSQTTRFAQQERALRQQVWRWRSPNQGPHPEAVWQLGTELGVDAILAYGMEPQSGTDYMWAYLYDIPYQRIYTRQGTTFWYETETAGTLTEMTQTLFREFQDFRMQQSVK